MNVVVINCSAKHYNLGAHKLADWLRSMGHNVQYSNGDPGLYDNNPSAVYLSVVFSWHAPLARQIAMRYLSRADVYCGGPGMFALGRWWHDETGLEAHRGLDMRFDRQRGNYLATFASRGCPVNCWFCVVPKIEGTEFTLDWDFHPAPMLCDNNLSALPVEFQDHIIRRYQETGTPLKDANSGFEPRTFDRDTYRRWSATLRGPWRFAFDEQRERADVERMMRILRDVRPGRKRVYVLIGNEPIDSCLDRARSVIAWGGEPYCQPVMPLNALSRQQLIVRHDWTEEKLRDMARYFNRYLWRAIPLSEYRGSKHAPARFAQVQE